jgi:hypothetical protein
MEAGQGGSLSPSSPLSESLDLPNEPEQKDDHADHSLSLDAASAKPNEPSPGAQYERRSLSLPAVQAEDRVNRLQQKRVPQGAAKSATGFGTKARPGLASPPAVTAFSAAKPLIPPDGSSIGKDVDKGTDLFSQSRRGGAKSEFDPNEVGGFPYKSIKPDGLAAAPSLSAGLAAPAPPPTPEKNASAHAPAALSIPSEVSFLKRESSDEKEVARSKIAPTSAEAKPKEEKLSNKKRNVKEPPKRSVPRRSAALQLRSSAASKPRSKAESAAAFFRLGQTYLRKGRKDAARRAFKNALKLDPRYEPARRALRYLSPSSPTP